jgi:hypothetical protein
VCLKANKKFGLQHGVNFPLSFSATVWLTLLLVKVVNGVSMHSKAVDLVLAYRNDQLLLAAQDLEFEGEETVGERKRRFLSRSVPGSPRISLYDFSGFKKQT